MNIRNQVVVVGIILLGSVIRLFGQDLFNLTEIFSKDYYGTEALKIDYDVGIEYYDIKNTEKDVKTSSSNESFNNILSPKYIYLNKSQNGLGTKLEYITNGENDFTYFPAQKGASISSSGIVPMRDRFFTDYLTFIPDFQQDRAALSSIISLLEGA